MSSKKKGPDFSGPLGENEVVYEVRTLTLITCDTPPPSGLSSKEKITSLTLINPLCRKKLFAASRDSSHCSMSAWLIVHLGFVITLYFLLIP